MGIPHAALPPATLLVAQADSGRHGPVVDQVVHHVRYVYRGTSPVSAADGGAVPSFALVQGDTVEIRVIGVDDGLIVGRTFDWRLEWATEENGGRDGCKKRIITKHW